MRNRHGTNPGAPLGQPGKATPGDGSGSSQFQPTHDQMMKTWLYALTTFALLICQGGAQLVSYWSFDTGADDVTGAHHGTLVNGASISTGNRGVGGGEALELNGGSGAGAPHVLTADPEGFDFNSDFTWHAYVRTNSLEGGLFGRTAASPTIHNQGAKSLFLTGGMAAWDTGWVGFVPSFVQVNDGEWHQVIATYTAATDRLDVFVDPAPGATTGAASVIHDVNRYDEHTHVHNGGIADTSFRIGHVSDNFRSAAIVGFIDEAAVFDQALSGEQLDQLITAGPVSFALPTFSKAFSPATIGPGATTTLTFTIHNRLATGVRGLSFTDELPKGVVVADPPQLVSDCGGTVTAPAGGTTITLSDGSLPASGSCTISVNVTSAVLGTHRNLSGDLLSDVGNSGPAAADLIVSQDVPGFSKSFSPSRVGLGGRSRLTFTIDHTLGAGPRLNFTFTDILPPGMAVADPANADSSCGGRVNAVPGSNIVGLEVDFANQFVLDNGASCTVSVDVVATSVGTLRNVSGELNSSNLSGQQASSGFATAELEVTADPIILSKRFLDDPLPPGGLVTLEYTLTNRSRDEVATGIRFVDELFQVLPGLTSVSPPQPGVCGANSLLAGDTTVKFDGGELSPGASCTFSVQLRVPQQAGSGLYPSTTGPVVADFGGRPVQATPASDTLAIFPVPELAMVFLPGSAIPGGEVTLRYRITNTSSIFPAEQISFLHELPAELASTVELPANGFCGPGSSMFFSPATTFDPALISVSNARLAPGTSCVFDLIMNVSESASTGVIPSSTDPLSATIDGEPVTAPPATGELRILSGPQLTKQFLQGTVVPGEVATLRFTIQHGAEAQAPAKNIRFTDDLSAAIPGMVALGLPKTEICGPDSVVRGTSIIEFGGGELNPGEICEFDVPVLIPQQAPLGIFTNTTSLVSADVAGLDVTSSPASADLLITTLSFSKRFLDTPIVPGGRATLEFTLRNSGGAPASNISFNDELSRVLPGLVSVSPPQVDLCGPGSQFAGTDNLSFQGGSLAAGAECSFRVEVQVPAGAQEGDYINTTSELVATVVEDRITLPPANAVLRVSDRLLAIEKTFLTDPVQAGELTSLRFRITNLHPTETVTDIAFTDALPAGLASISGTRQGICNDTGQITGTTTLSFSGGKLAGGTSCDFAVEVLVPGGTTGGVVENLTSEITGSLAGLTVRGSPAGADLSINELPEISGGIEFTSFVRQANGNISFQWQGRRGSSYCVQWSINLVDWFEIGPAQAGDDAPIGFVDTRPQAPRMFYRIVPKTPE